MTKEEMFFSTLRDVFVGARVEGESGYVNLMRIKARYYEQGVFPQLQKDIAEALKPFPEFREELFDRLYTFFRRYFSESGSIYFRYTPLHEKVYEQVYTDERDVVLFWKTHMLYYVKTDRLFRNMGTEVDGFRFFFDVSALEHKKANEKRSLVYEFKERREDGALVFTVVYSEGGHRTKLNDIRKAIKEALGLSRYTDAVPTEETLERAFRVFERQSEVDYFINKDARKFLREQFDLWLYQYIFEPEQRNNTVWSEKRIRQLQALKDIAYKIIDFIAQFEDELVRIWNKPKFVLNANYVITLDRIAARDQMLLERILAHPGMTQQVQEWQDLGMVGEDFKLEHVGEADLKGIHLNPRYQYLPLDTRYFKDLELEILGLFDHLDQSLDGWLIKSENYQALNTILPKFRKRVKCIYIDPPYNTGSDEFIYRDRYQHSCWLSMMADRLALAREWMRRDGAMFISIDANERDRLKSVADLILSEDGYLNTFVWINNLKGRQISGRGAAGTHEYVLAYGNPDVGRFYIPIPRAKSIMPSAYKGFDYEVRHDDAGTYVVKNELYNTNSKFNEETRPNLIFNIHWNPQTGEIRFSEIDEDVEFEGFLKIPPKENNDGVHRYHAWRWSKEKISRESHNLEFVNCGDSIRIFTKVRGFECTVLKDVITDIATDSGQQDLSDCLGKAAFSSYPKPVKFVEVFAGLASNDELVLDFFAGSGTTAHAVINLNREDGGQRKYILVEMADYFDTVLLPRVKKAVFSDQWKDGKAQEDGKGISHFVKYYCLEQYEDVLCRAHYADTEPLFVQADPYSQYVFLRDRKLLDNAQTGERVVTVDREKEEVCIDPSKLYKNIDLAETISCVTGKWIRRIRPHADDPARPGEVEFEDGTRVDLTSPPWELVKPLVWW